MKRVSYVVIDQNGKEISKPLISGDESWKGAFVSFKSKNAIGKAMEFINAMKSIESFKNNTYNIKRVMQ